MAKRVSITRAQRESRIGAELLELCQRVTEDGRLSEKGIKEIVRWLRNNRDADLPAKDFLLEKVARIVADRHVTLEEQKELYKSIEAILPPNSRKVAVRQRKELEVACNDCAKLAKNRGETEQRKRVCSDGETNTAIAENGREYNLNSLTQRVEYGEETFLGIARRLGDEVAAMVEKNVKLSWFNGNWNVDLSVLASWEGHLAKAVAASCCEGLSL